MACRIFVILVLWALSLIGAILSAQEAIRETTKPTAEIKKLQESPFSTAQSEAQECPRIFSESGTISPAKSWGIRSPDGQVLAWSVALLEKNPEHVRGQMFLRHQQTGQRETIFETLTKAGKILSTRPNFNDLTYNIFCVVDRSIDGNYLLIQEVLGYQSSDVWDDLYWIYSRMRRQRGLIDLKPLKHAIEKYWQKNALDFRDIRYQTFAVGWEKGKSNRVVFMAFTYHQEASLFLGIWSIGSTVGSQSS